MTARLRIVLRLGRHLLAVFGILCILVVLREAEPAPAERTLQVHGAFDVSGHLLTALMIGIGVRAIRLPLPLWSLLLGGVILDLGHILAHYDYVDPIAGSSRNGSHSIAVLALIALVGFLDARHANVWLGIAVGAVSHLWRDMGTGFVPLFWPAMDRVEATTFARYLVGLVAVAVAAIGAGALLDTYRSARAIEHPPT